MNETILHEYLIMQAESTLLFDKCTLLIMLI